MCVKKILGLRIEGQPLTLMSLMWGAHVPDSYPWEVSLLWLDSLICQPQLDLQKMALLLYLLLMRPAALMSDRTCGSHQHMPIANPLYYKCIPWSEGMLCRILLRGSNTCKPRPNINANWRLMVRNMCQFQSRGTAAPSRVEKVQCHQLATK